MLFLVFFYYLFIILLSSRCPFVFCYFVLLFCFTQTRAGSILDLSDNKIGELGGGYLVRFLKFILFHRCCFWPRLVILFFCYVNLFLLIFSFFALQGIALGDNHQIQRFSCRQNPLGDTGLATTTNNNNTNTITTKRFI